MISFKIFRIFIGVIDWDDIQAKYQIFMCISQAEWFTSITL